MVTPQNHPDHYPLKLRVGSSNDDLISRLKNAANAGDPAAQYTLAKHFLEGDKVQASPELYLHYIQLAAAQGNPEAAYDLGENYLWGQSSNMQSREQAIYYYHIAADQGDSNAQLKLGYLYSRGVCVEQSFEKAAYYYQLAAAQHDMKACLLLARLYELGQGLPQSFEKAKYYYSMGLEKIQKKDADEWEKQGFLLQNVAKYRKSKGQISKSKTIAVIFEMSFESFQWMFLYYKGLADKGDLNAIMKVIECYREGIGVEISFKAMLEYLNLITKKEIENVTVKNTASFQEFSLLVNRAEIDLGSQRCLAWRLKQDFPSILSPKLFQHYLFLAANGGICQAQLELGRLYDCGDDFQCDPNKAAEWYQKAADQGNVHAQYYIGTFFERGIGVEKSYKNAFTYFKKAAEQGMGAALAKLGIYYAVGDVVSKSPEIAQQYYELCCQASFDEQAAWDRIRYIRSLPLQKTNLLQRCIEETILYYICKMRTGKLESNSRLKFATLLRSNEDLERNLDILIHLYHLVADANIPEGFRWLGYFYEMGMIPGEEQSDEKAFFYYSQAAALNDPCALGLLGQCYEYGVGVEQSKEQAGYYYHLCVHAAWNLPEDLEEITFNIGHIQKFVYYKAKAFFNDKDANYHLGMCYKNGDGVKRSAHLALISLQLAAAQGHREAQFEAGEILDFVKLDFVSAAKYYYAAAEQQHPKAQASLGYLYQYGLGVSQSIEKALEYYKKAAKQSNPTGIVLLREYYQKCGEVSSQYLDIADYYNDLLSEVLPDKDLEHLFNEELEALIEQYPEGNRNRQFREGFLYHRDPYLCKSAKPNFEKAARQGSEDAKIILSHINEVPEKDIKLLNSFVNDVFDASVGKLSKVLQQNKDSFQTRPEIEPFIRESLEHNFKLASDFDFGMNVYRCDPQMAAGYYLAAASLGYAPAQFEIGSFYEKGVAVDQSYDEALKFYQQAAGQNYVFALGRLAQWHLRGIHKNPSQELAQQYSERCANCSFDEKTALERIKYARKTNCQETKRLERCYDEILIYYEFIAENSSEVKCKMADIYRQGSGRPLNRKAYWEKSMQVSKSFYSLSAEQGFPRAERWLGYFLERDSTANPQEVFLLYQKAAEKGDPCALGLLAQCYEEGKGTPQDLNKSRHYYELCKTADWNLEELNEISFTWGHVQLFVYNKAHAALGDKEASEYVARCYETGDGVIPIKNEKVG